MIRISVVDDHAAIRSGVREFLTQPDMAVVSEAATGREAEALFREGNFDVMLLDISLPDHTGIDVLRYGMKRRNDLKVLMLSAHPETAFAPIVLRMGAMGYLSKASEPDEMVWAVRTVFQGRKYITPAVAELLADIAVNGKDAAFGQLTGRELQLLLHVASGASTGAIATTLSISPATVAGLLHRLKEKLGLHTRSDLTRYAVQNGLIQ